MYIYMYINRYIYIYIYTTEGVTRRSGQPRVKWVETTLDKLWKLIGQNMDTSYKYSIMNLENVEHVHIIHRAAEMDLHEFSPSYLP